MNLPSAACLLLLSAASPHAAETQPEAQASARPAISGKTGTTSFTTALPPFALRYAWLWPFRKNSDKRFYLLVCPKHILIRIHPFE